MKKILLAAFCLCITDLYAQVTLQPALFSSGFASPVAIANCGDNRLFVVERLGKIFAVDSSGTKSSTPFLDIDSIVNNGNDERGLLGLAFDPDYQNNGYFFVYFIDNSNNSQLARYSRNPSDPNEALATSKEIVLTVIQPSFTNHKGGNIAFGADGYLYLAFGDGGDTGDPLNNAQNDQTLLGKMIRIDVSSLPYTIPPTNPFVGSAPLDEIWALGLRNPWKWSFDRLTNDLWIGDVGQGNLEEINFASASSTGGENYGWRCYEASAVYDGSGCSGMASYDFPVYEYPHSGPNSGCSVTGGFVYRGTREMALFGQYLFSDYCSGNIWSLDENLNFTDYGSFGFGVSAFGEDLNGELYYVNVSNGNLYSIRTNQCQPVAYITNADTTFLCTGPVTLSALEGSGLTYQWLRNSFPIPGGTASSYTLNVGSNYQVVVTNQSGCSTVSANKVVINNRPLAAITGDADYCTGETALLNASTGTGYTYQWKYKNINISGANLDNYTANQPGSYRVLVTNPNGCTRLSNPWIITGPPSGGSILQGSATICIGDSVEITAKATGSNFTYQWLKNNIPLSGATSQNYFATETGFYKVTVTNQFGCSKTGSGKAIYAVSCLKMPEATNWQSYSIFTVEGKLVYTDEFNGAVPELTTYLRNRYDELKGLYFIRLHNKELNQQQTVKILF